MRLTFPLMQERNPIALRERRAYERAVPRWARRLDTVGIIVAALVVGAGLIAFKFYYGVASIMGTPVLRSFDIYALIQIVIGVFYGAVLLRYTAAGVGVAGHYLPESHADLLLTEVPIHKIIKGQWAAALHQVRGWIVALGLVRIMMSVALLYRLSPDAGASFEAANLALIIFAGWVLALCEAIATCGLGILVNHWLRQGMFAWLVATLLRLALALPFIWFPSFSYYLTSPFNDLRVRWIEYTWFTFADGGTTAMLRLSGTGWRYSVSRGLIALIASTHALLVMGLIAFALTILYWRWWRGRHFDFVWPRQLENWAVIGAALLACLSILLRWADFVSNVPGLSPVTVTYHPLDFLWQLQRPLGIVLGLTILRAILAGVRQGRVYRASQPSPAASVRNMLRMGFATTRRLRGWGIGLALVLATGFGVLIVGQFIGLHETTFWECYSPETAVMCRTAILGRSFVQWGFGLAMILALSGLTLFSGVLLGLGTGVIFRSRWLALLVALVYRVIPLWDGLLPPDAVFGNPMSNVLIIRWLQDPIRVLGDNGISLLVGMSEPFWHVSHPVWQSNVIFCLLAFLLLTYMLLAYGFGSVLLARWALRRQARTGCEAPSVRLVEAALPASESEIRCA